MKSISLKQFAVALFAVSTVTVAPVFALSTAEVESLAEQYIKVLALGPANILSDTEMAIVLEKFKTYGQRAQSAQP